MKSKGYTLWLRPTGEANNKFASIIKKWAKEYRISMFQPHVTLLGELMCSEENLEKDLIEKIKELVSNQKPFKIELEELDYEDHFFRTLFVRAKKTEALLELNAQAKEIFKKKNTPPYMPHLSILYGTFTKALKEELVKEIGKNQSMKFEVSSIHLIKGGRVKDWKIIGEFPFKS
ncbi:2'-5' RNA ligase family protein [Patescibacteria group bacterium]|nr:2'-5' RNA ligase family protein [Patescibacteria group bacterium]